jgi:hypothetical protein
MDKLNTMKETYRRLCHLVDTHVDHGQWYLANMTVLCMAYAAYFIGIVHTSKSLSGSIFQFGLFCYFIAPCAKKALTWISSAHDVLVLATREYLNRKDAEEVEWESKTDEKEYATKARERQWRQLKEFIHGPSFKHGGGFIGHIINDDEPLMPRNRRLLRERGYGVYYDCWVTGERYLSKRNRMISDSTFFIDIISELAGRSEQCNQFPLLSYASIASMICAVIALMFSALGFVAVDITSTRSIPSSLCATMIATLVFLVLYVVLIVCNIALLCLPCIKEALFSYEPSGTKQVRSATSSSTNDDVELEQKDLEDAQIERFKRVLCRADYAQHVPLTYCDVNGCSGGDDDDGNLTRVFEGTLKWVEDAGFSVNENHCKKCYMCLKLVHRANDRKIVCVT